MKTRTTKPELNTMMFLKVADAIECGEPYDQNDPCHCVAGVTNLLSGNTRRGDGFANRHTLLTERGIGLIEAVKRLFSRRTLDWAGGGKMLAGMLELGLTIEEARWLFAGDWKPRRGRSVPEELRHLAKGRRNWPRSTQR